MDTQNQILLNKIVDYQIFTATGSALAAQIEYPRTSLQRALNGIAKASTIETIMKKIYNYYCISSADLTEFIRIVEKGKYLYELILEAEQPDLSTLHTSDRILIALTAAEFECFSPRFQKQVAPILKDIYRNDPTLYFGIAIIVYLKMQKTDFYTGDSMQKYKKTSQHIYEIMKEKYPENINGHRCAIGYLTESYLNEMSPCLYDAVENLLYMLRYLADSEFLKTALEVVGMIFPEWGKVSYWHTSGKSYAKGEKLWKLFAVESASEFYGAYMGQRFEAGNNIQTFVPEDFFSLILSEAETEEQEAEVLLTVMPDTVSDIYNHTMYYGTYKYDESCDELIFTWAEEYPKHLPQRIKRITEKENANKEEKVWAVIANKFENRKEDPFLQSYLRYLETEYMDETYDIQNVIISRQYFSLIIRTKNKEYCYRIPIDKYAFLKKISVFEEVIIKKQIQENSLYVEWPMVGYQIPLVEFEKQKSHHLSEDIKDGAVV